eukprot:XP_005267209.1 protein phosphatase 1 regulatory subunit 14C isoform X1 [Homo sapiens]
MGTAGLSSHCRWSRKLNCGPLTHRSHSLEVASELWLQRAPVLHGEEEEMPEVEIDIDDLLDADSDEERASKLQEALVDCYKPTEEFIKELLSRIRGMRKLSPPQKKSV